MSPSLAELMQHIASPEFDTTLLAEVLLCDHAHSGPFAPSLRLNPRYLPPTDHPMLFEGVADHLRRQRQRRYFARIAHGWAGPRLVAQGDSWFQFPLVRDIVGQLDQDHAIYCPSTADPIHNPAAQDELASAISEICPDAVLVSAGGNDLFGSSRVRALVGPTRSRAPRGVRSSSYFRHFLQTDLMPRFEGLFRQIRAVDRNVPVFVHSYAYATPRDGQWLGRPLQALGIADPQAQCGVVRGLIDEFHAHLEATMAAIGLGGLYLVDCRTAVGASWFDELTPNNLGFERVAGQFRAALAPVI